MVFLQSDRYIEFHAQHGRYYRIRIPKPGRDLAYHSASCEIYLVGVGSVILFIISRYRFDEFTAVFVVDTR